MKVPSGWTGGYGTGGAAERAPISSACTARPVGVRSRTGPAWVPENGIRATTLSPSQRHRVPLYACAMSLLRDRDAAMDAVQETFLVALTRLDEIRDPASVGRWLQTVVRNCCLMQIRRHRREIVSSDVELPAHIPGPDQVLEGHALRNWVWTALEALTEEERVTLVLRYFIRCDRYQAIAAITGAPSITRPSWKRHAVASGRRSTRNCTCARAANVPRPLPRRCHRSGPSRIVAWPRRLVRRGACSHQHRGPRQPCRAHGHPGHHCP